MSVTKKKKSTIMVNPDIYKETRMMAIWLDVDISQFVEQALREKITRTLKEQKSSSSSPILQKLKESRQET
jgi:hypothetical protein